MTELRTNPTFAAGAQLPAFSFEPLQGGWIADIRRNKFVRLLRIEKRTFGRLRYQPNLTLVVGLDCQGEAIGSDYADPANQLSLALRQRIFVDSRFAQFV